MGEPALTERIKQHLRRSMTTPHLAALLPAGMIVVYWYGGEYVMMLVAILFPSLLVAGGMLTKPKPKPNLIKDLATGLPLQHKLLDRLDQGFISDSEFEKICLIIELDEVSVLQTELGQEGMDRLLATIAERMRSALRETDLVCALATGRYGISVDKQPRLRLEGVLQLAARLQSSIGEPISIDQKRVLVSCCIGFSLPQRSPDTTGEALLAAAESALISAINAGPGSIRAYSIDMPRPAARVEHKNEDLENALNNGEIQPWFQPQICANTGKLTGCEALARWQHPTLGLIAPGAFLAEISKVGLLDRLREVVLHTSLSTIVKWDHQGIPIPIVAINLSIDELNNPALHEIIKWELDRFDVSAERLALEISERFLSTSLSDVARHNIKALKTLGCTIDLGDYGQGNASIAAIKQLGVDRIKLDRSLITHADSDIEQQTVIAAALAVAHQLGVSAVAEGIETAAEQKALTKLGCDQLQGYFIAKPMAANNLSAWARTRVPKSQFLKHDNSKPGKTTAVIEKFPISPT